MTAADRSRLAKLLGLLGSDIAGERDAAAFAVTRFIRSKGLDWATVLKPAVERQLPEMGTWRQTAAQCLERRPALRQWEVGFLTDLPGFRRLSVKQRYVLQGIAARVLGDTP